MSKHNITLCRYSENMQVIAGLSVSLVAEHCQQNLPSSHQRSQGRVAAMPPTLDDDMIQCNDTFDLGQTETFQRGQGARAVNEPSQSSLPALVLTLEW